LIVERYLDAAEYSVQGVMYDGTPCILGYCSKVIAVQPDPLAGCLRGFREIAHMLVGPGRVPAAVNRFASRCAAAMGYHDGPFHIDFREDGRGPIFIEMGFRLSGAAVTDLVRIVAGCDWADLAFSQMLGDGVPPRFRSRTACAAHVLAFSEDQIEAAQRIPQPVAVAVDRLTNTIPELTADEKTRLSADLSRHTGPIARIRLSGAEPDIVRHAVFDLCLPHHVQEVLS
jgi:biotin carboxylase